MWMIQLIPVVNPNFPAQNFFLTEVKILDECKKHIPTFFFQGLSCLAHYKKGLKQKF